MSQTDKKILNGYVQLNGTTKANTKVTVKIDEALLRNISGMTGGKYFRATTNEGLQEIYDEIDELEKTDIEVTTIKRYSE